MDCEILALLIYAIGVVICFFGSAWLAPKYLPKLDDIDMFLICLATIIWPLTLLVLIFSLLVKLWKLVYNSYKENNI